MTKTKTYYVAYQLRNKRFSRHRNFAQHIDVMLNNVKHLANASCEVHCEIAFNGDLKVLRSTQDDMIHQVRSNIINNTNKQLL